MGAGSLLASRNAGDRANIRYFFWILGALNLLPGAGYFVFSGLFGIGDWNAVIDGLPHPAALRIGMTVFGAGLYLLSVRLLAISVYPFAPDRPTYNTVGRLPYYTACLFSCAAGCAGPLGLKLFILSTIPAAFGGSSGLTVGRQLAAARSPRRGNSSCIGARMVDCRRRTWEPVTSLSLVGAYNFLTRLTPAQVLIATFLSRSDERSGRHQRTAGFSTVPILRALKYRWDL